MTVEIDVSTNQILVVKDGQVIPIAPPTSGFGSQAAIWVKGKVDRVESLEQKKI
ncbi:DUF3954 domain-containing protein [Bacillus sp. YZJH907-2]|uniref:DUF3954 domain-containing protein n=2 Tax=Halalkalibacter suaedae TaxID=2822140 RepID=A0A941AN14_9BACI|nr:DUF3954 domain-containing protein [Bacillus suaedae]MBP3951145.1 DUF3954 domain-containing protein [Bacillus suaedae]